MHGQQNIKLDGIIFSLCSFQAAEGYEMKQNNKLR
jgi:hypothetical protein